MEYQTAFLIGNKNVQKQSRSTVYSTNQVKKLIWSTDLNRWGDADRYEEEKRDKSCLREILRSDEEIDDRGHATLSVYACLSLALINWQPKAQCRQRHKAYNTIVFICRETLVNACSLYHSSTTSCQLFYMFCIILLILNISAEAKLPALH